MENSTLQDLYVHELMDIASAEAQITKALPTITSACTSPELKEALKKHLGETKEHLTRVKGVLKRHGVKGEGETCKGMEGLLQEGSKIMEEFPKGEVLDLALISACQKVEHYEICGYGTLRAMARSLGHEEDVKEFTEVLYQESQADDGLSQVALFLNSKAAAA